MSRDVAHDLECADAAYAALIERAAHRGNRREQRSLLREWTDYRKRMIELMKTGEPQ